MQTESRIRFCSNLFFLWPCNALSMWIHKTFFFSVVVESIEKEKHLPIAYTTISRLHAVSLCRTEREKNKFLLLNRRARASYLLERAYLLASNPRLYNSDLYQRRVRLKTLESSIIINEPVISVTGYDY
jgi:hypothetical protein